MRVTGLLLAALLCVCFEAEAQTGNVFTRTGSGARAAGMANAFIGISDDGTAASWNPAGLGQLRKPELSVVTTALGQSVGFAGYRTRDDLAVFTPMTAACSSTHLDFASLALPATFFGKPVTFQAAWRRLYTLDFRQNNVTIATPTGPDGPPPLRVDLNLDTVGGIDVVSIAGAVKLTPRVAIGASFNQWRGDWRENAAVSLTPLEAPGPPLFAMESGANHLDGHGLGLGLMFTYPRWSVGLVYQSPLRGDFSANTRGQTSRDPQPPGALAEGEVRLPQAFGAGAAWRPTPAWTVAFDLTWDQWTETLFTPKGGPTISLFDGLPKALSGTRDTLSANAGAECLFHGEGFVVPLRFGVALEPQGPRSAYTRDPVNYVMLAAGTGYNTNSLKFDAALQYRWAHFQDGTDFGIGDGGPYLPLAVGEHSVKEWRVKLSLIVRAADTEKLQRRLKKIFGGG